MKTLNQLYKETESNFCELAAKQTKALERNDMVKVREYADMMKSYQADIHYLNHELKKEEKRNEGFSYDKTQVLS